MPPSPKRILIAPLDWGLGHTTRCIPVIRTILALGHEPVFAGNKFQQFFISKPFPEIRRLFLEGYDVRYSKRALIFTLLWQLPRLVRRLRVEHEWITHIVEKEEIDGIISDNRYGLWHPQIPSAIITHQPGVITPVGAWADTIVRKIHYSYLNQFDSVWIPDMPGTKSLAGLLSHPLVLPPRARYIGWLSQFQMRQYRGKTGVHVLILLSGPEPQRSMLSDKLWAQAQAIKRPIVFVEGKADVNRQNIPQHIQHFDLLAADRLQPFVEDASMVVCRSGYSTLMDLVHLQRPAALIPTPGQTEQEYLANSLREQGTFYAASQPDFCLKEAIESVERESRAHFPVHGDLLTPALQDWLNTL